MDNTPDGTDRSERSVSETDEATATTGATESRPDGGEAIVEYGIEDEPPTGEAVTLGVQHLLTMFLSTVALPLVIAGAIGLGPADTTFVLQMALLVAGIATIVQAYSVGPVGARLPIVMGTSAIFVAPLIDIGNQFGLAAIFGAVIIAAPVEIVLGYFIDDIRGLFPPLVTGIVVMLVGLTLVPTAIDYAAGGPGAETYGNVANLAVAALVFGLAIVLNQFFDGLARTASVLVAVVVGYLASIPFGLLDLSRVGEVGWLALPIPLQYGVEFQPGAVLVVAFAYVITAMETIGDISGTTESVGRDPDGDELRGGLVADGAMSGLAGLFGAFPNTSFSQNVGLITFTGVASRYVVAICGAFLVVLGFVPKVAAVVADARTRSRRGRDRSVRHDLLGRSPDRRPTGGAHSAEPDDYCRLDRAGSRRRGSSRCPHTSTGRVTVVSRFRVDYWRRHGIATEPRPPERRWGDDGDSGDDTCDQQ